ncbi:MAG: transposase [Prevotellaceae bacterium]|nr:transposase [Prevotellaceae bacterium]
MLNDILSAMRFCELNVEDDIHGHSVLSRFCTELTQKKSFDRLLKKINRRLAQQGFINYPLSIVSCQLFIIFYCTFDDYGYCV